MEIIKILKKTNEKFNYAENVCKYINDERALEVYGFGVTESNPDIAADQMKATRTYFNKMNTNPVVHIVVSHQGNVKSEEDAKRVTRQIGQYLGENYQTLACVHEKDRNDSHFHSHFAVNPVCYKDGKMYNTSRANLAGLMKCVENFTGDKAVLVFEKK